MPDACIIDSRDGNTLLNGLQLMCATGERLRIATAFFSLDALPRGYCPSTWQES